MCAYSMIDLAVAQYNRRAFYLEMYAIASHNMNHELEMADQVFLLRFEIFF